MAQRPEELLHDLPPQFRWQPGIRTDPIDMEFLISRIENPQLRNQLIALRLEAVAQVLRIAADAHAKAAGLIAGQR